MKKALIVKPGDPNCIHYEEIIDHIGTCRKCKRQKLYPTFDEMFYPPVILDKARASGLYNRGKKRIKERVI